jgi:hypothetical protein
MRSLVMLLCLASGVLAAPLDDYAAFVRSLDGLDRTAWFKAWALHQLGPPYVLDPQGEGQGKDADPVFTPGKVDCTVLVLQMAASLGARSVPELLDGMRRANYRRWDADGTVRWQDRYHYSEDRNLSSPLFRDITREVFPVETLRREAIVLNRKPDGSETMPLGWDRAIELTYRPTAGLTRDDVARLPPVCGVMFVKRSNRKLGLLVGHEGLVFQGRVLVHASSKYRRVSMEPFVPYAHTRDGIVIYEISKRARSVR